jgi:hypothetical protein
VAKINFSYLLAGLLALLIVEPFIQGLPRSAEFLQLAFTGVIAVGVFSLARMGWEFYLGLVLAAIGVAAAMGFLWLGHDALRIVDLAAITLFCLLSISVKMRYVVFLPGPVTMNRVVGALCIYLLIGVVWATFYGFVELIEPGSFRYTGHPASHPLEHFLYYSFVTLTTMGYGDIAPVHPVARTLAYLEAVVGQIYIAVLIAGLIGRRAAGLGFSHEDDGLKTGPGASEHPVRAGAERV